MDKLLKKLNPANLFREHAFSELSREKRYQLFKKFSNGEFIDSKEEEKQIEEYASMPLMRLGFEPDPEKNGEIRRTASLTALGHSFYFRERVRRTPIVNFFYCLRNAVIG